MLEEMYHWGWVWSFRNSKSSPMSLLSAACDTSVELSATSPTPWVPVWHPAPSHSSAMMIMGQISETVSNSQLDYFYKSFMVMMLLHRSWNFNSNKSTTNKDYF